MDILQKQKIIEWLDIIPDDFKSAIGSETMADDNKVIGLLDGLGKNPVDKWLPLIQQSENNLKDFGRPRRIRLMAYLVGLRHPRASQLLEKLLIKDGDSDTEGQSGATVLFIEDLKILNKILAQRIAHAVSSNNNINILKEAASSLNPAPKM